MAAIAADYDNDGNTDLLVTGYGRASFTEIKGTERSRTSPKRPASQGDGWSIGSAWLDYDKDGCMDVFIGRYVKFDPKYRAYYRRRQLSRSARLRRRHQRPDHNNCNGTFTDVSAKSGIGEFKDAPWASPPPISTAMAGPTSTSPTTRPRTSSSTTSTTARSRRSPRDAGAAFGQNGESTSAMGPIFADIDGDGRFDLWVTDSKYNRLLRNTGRAAFEDVTQRGSLAGNRAVRSWGTGIYDFDNDGLPDIFILHGGLVHLVPQEHSMFRNLGGGKFADVSPPPVPSLNGRQWPAAPALPTTTTTAEWMHSPSRSAAPPRCSTTSPRPATTGLPSNLSDKKSNRDGLGAKLELLAGGRKQVAQRVGGCGYLSQDDGRVHFGVGQATRIDKLKVTWPSGKVQTLRDIAADKILAVEEQ